MTALVVVLLAKNDRFRLVVLFLLGLIGSFALKCVFSLMPFTSSS